MRSLSATSLIAALFSVLTANAQSVPTQAASSSAAAGPAQASTDKHSDSRLVSVKLGRRTPTPPATSWSIGSLSPRIRAWFATSTSA